jgi:Ion channel
MTNFQNPLTLFTFYFENIFHINIAVFILVSIFIFAIHGFTILFITERYEYFLHNNSINLKKRVGFIPYTLTMLVIMSTHLMDLLYLAYMLDGMKVFPDQLTSFYFAGEMYTTLGYGSYQLAPEWRGLPFIIGFTGLFSASISGAGLFTMLQDLGTVRSKARSHQQ